MINLCRGGSEVASQNSEDPISGETLEKDPPGFHPVKGVLGKHERAGCFRSRRINNGELNHVVLLAGSGEEIAGFIYYKGNPRKGSEILVLFWMLGLVVIFAFTLSFSVVQTSAFFSAPELSALKKIDFFSRYLPTNIFSVRNEAVVPAIVVFSVFLGWYSWQKWKNRLLLWLSSVLAKALSRMTSMVIKKN